MAYATVMSCTLAGVSALPVIVEVHLAGGLPGMSIVGLPQSAVKESKDRVKAAIQNAGFRFPMSRVVVNLAPADLPKRGGRFDLPIALAILKATGQLPDDAAQDLVVIGELGLTGELRAVSGVLPTAQSLSGGDRALLVPMVNGREATFCGNIRVYGVESLSAAVEGVRQRSRLIRLKPDSFVESSVEDDSSRKHKQGPMDMSQVLGQATARRALELAAAGRHNLLMSGPPGTGKSMLASRLPSIQPPMSESEALEAASVASVSHQGFDETLWRKRPFRSPHHTASGVALVGGGVIPAPGEISLAHQGVLFLDELPEFSRRVLDVLREPLETGRITISRAARQAEFPARFQLIAAMNPCPCGFDGDTDVARASRCRCAPDVIERYLARISGPFLDRIDLRVNVRRLTREERRRKQHPESSDVIRSRVIAATKRQVERQGCVNAELDPTRLLALCDLKPAEHELLDAATERLDLSMRAVHRVLKVARTIADLDGSEGVAQEHLAEALAFRTQ